MSQLSQMTPPSPAADRERFAPAALPSALPEPLPDSLSVNEDDFPDPAEALEHAEWLSAVRRAGRNPPLAEWSARTGVNTVLMRADPQDLLDLFDAMRAERRDEEERERTRDAMYGVLRQRQIGPLEQIPILLREGLDRDVENLSAFLASWARQLGNGTFIDSEGERQAYSSALLNGLADYMDAARDAANRSRPAPLQAQTPVGRYIQDVIRQIPQMGMQIGATAAGGPLAGAVMAGANTAGGHYRELRRQGVSHDRAFAASTANAVLQAPLEQIGLGGLLSVFKARGAREILKRSLEGTGREALIEYLQSYPEEATTLWATLRSDEDAQAWFDHLVAALPETHRKGMYAAAVAAPFGALGGLGKAAHAKEQARRAADFHARQRALHERAEAVDMKSFAPRQLEEALRAGGLEGSVFLPASDLLTLHQSGTGILAFLGVPPRTVQEAAAHGQDLELPLARLHAFLDPDEFAAVARIMREAPDQPNMLEARDLEQRLAEDAAETAAAYADYAAQREAIRTELDRIRQEAAAALPPHVAGEEASAAPDAYARLLLAWAQRREARSGVPIAESLRRFRVARGKAPQPLDSSVERAFLQPLNAGVDLDALVPAVVISPRFTGQNPKVLRKRFPDDVRRAVLAEFASPTGVVNTDTGWRVGMSGADFHEHMKFSDTDVLDGLTQLEAVVALPELMRNAKLVESYDDKKNVSTIKKMHRFQAALCIGDKAYSVKLTVKEYKDGSLELDSKAPFKVYHHRLEKEMPAGNSTALSHSDQPPQPSADIPIYTIRQLLEDVKDSDGKFFFVANDAPEQSDRARFRQAGVAYPDNGREVGRVSPDIARTLRLDKPGSIVLDDKGLRHIEERHGKEIRALGFADAQDFVDAVLGTVSAVYDVDGKGRKYDLVSRTMTPQGRVMVRLEFAESGDYYQVVTASTLRKNYYDKKMPLWERAQSNHSTEGTPDAVSGQSGVLHQQHAADGDTINAPDGSVNLRIAEENSPRGSIAPVDEGYLIRLYDRADLSTILHETGHFFLLEMEQDIQAGIADTSTVQDLAAIRRWIGARDNAPITREQHETFARGFERYLREGKAPSRELESLFARFRQWLIHLYRKAAHLHVELTDDVRAVFNRLLAEEHTAASRPLP